MTNSGWRPTGTAEALAHRAATLATARQFFARRNILEVETPILGHYGVTDPHISSLTARDATNPQQQFWLRSSPEYHMKRLLAAGIGDIYQIAKVFRGGETGTQHQPEFTMIEWYRLGFELEQMIEETCALLIELSQVSSNPVGDFVRINYADAFIQACSVNPLTADTASLCEVAQLHLRDQPDASLANSLGDNRQAWLDLLASHLVYPALPRGIFVVVENYPASQAMLARINPLNPATSMRFEVFLNGTELANGFHELNNAVEQADRFAADRRQRRQLGLPDMETDTYLLDALTAGLPDCSGVAVGLDRVLLTTNNWRKLDATLSFLPGH